MTEITIGFSRRRGVAPISWIIQLCENTNFSHVYVQMKSATLDRSLIYHATSIGVYFLGKPVFESNNIVVEEHKLIISNEDKIKLLQWCVDNSGKPYGKLQIVGLGLIRLAKLFGLNIKNIFSNGEKAYVCTELVAAALRHVNIAQPEHLDLLDLTTTRNLVIAAVRKQNG